MIRKTLTILSLIGLLLSVGLWGMSFYGFHARWSRYSVTDEHGSFRVNLYLEDSVFTWVRGASHFKSFPPELSVVEHFRQVNKASWSFGENRLKATLSSLSRPRWTLGYISCPLWIPAALFGAAFWISYAPLHRRRKRKKLGLCVKCGYNLKGLTEPRCPECNTHFENHD